MIMLRAPRRVRLWPGMVFALIGLNMLIVLGTIIASQARHAAFAIEPDYDRKALHWEESARQTARNAALGWTIRFDEVSSGRVAVFLLDRSGDPIRDAQIDVEAFHHAQAGMKVMASLEPAPSGGYAGDASIRIPGLWEFRFTVRRGSETYTVAMTRAILGDHP